jgi:hypothetical protein
MNFAFGKKIAPLFCALELNLQSNKRTVIAQRIMNFAISMLFK